MKRRSEVTNPESADLGLWKQKPPLGTFNFLGRLWTYCLCPTHTTLGMALGTGLLQKNRKNFGESAFGSFVSTAPKALWIKCPTELAML